MASMEFTINKCIEQVCAHGLADDVPCLSISSSTSPEKEVIVDRARLYRLRAAIVQSGLVAKVVQ